jgi:dihydroneopterin triphosphate diphosphatase
MTHASQQKRQKVQVWLYYQNPQTQSTYFLLLLTLPERGSFWQPITGGVEEGEVLDEAAKREVKEETGLELDGMPQALGSSFEYERNGVHFTETGFFQEIPFNGTLPPRIRLASYEHSDYRWVKAKTAIQMVGYQSNIQMLNLVLNRLKVSMEETRGCTSGGIGSPS